MTTTRIIQLDSNEAKILTRLEIAVSTNSSSETISFDIARDREINTPEIVIADAMLLSEESRLKIAMALIENQLPYLWYSDAKKMRGELVSQLCNSIRNSDIRGELTELYGWLDLLTTPASLGQAANIIRISAAVTKIRENSRDYVHPFFRIEGFEALVERTIINTALNGAVEIDGGINDINISTACEALGQLFKSQDTLNALNSVMIARERSMEARLAAVESIARIKLTHGTKEWESRFIAELPEGTFEFCRNAILSARAIFSSPTSDGLSMSIMTLDSYLFPGKESAEERIKASMPVQKSAELDGLCIEALKRVATKGPDNTRADAVRVLLKSKRTDVILTLFEMNKNMDANRYPKTAEVWEAGFMAGVPESATVFCRNMIRSVRVMISNPTNDGLSMSIRTVGRYLFPKKGSVEERTKANLSARKSEELDELGIEALKRVATKGTDEMRANAVVVLLTSKRNDVRILIENMRQKMDARRYPKTVEVLSGNGNGKGQRGSDAEELEMDGLVMVGPVITISTTKPPPPPKSSMVGRADPSTAKAEIAPPHAFIRGPPPPPPRTGDGPRRLRNGG